MQNNSDGTDPCWVGQGSKKPTSNLTFLYGKSSVQPTSFHRWWLPTDIFHLWLRLSVCFWRIQPVTATHSLSLSWTTTIYHCSNYAFPTILTQSFLTPSWLPSYRLLTFLPLHHFFPHFPPYSTKISWYIRQGGLLLKPSLILLSSHLTSLQKPTMGKTSYLPSLGFHQPLL